MENPNLVLNDCEMFFSYEPNIVGEDAPKIVWDKDFPETDKWDYTVACASGIVSSVLDAIFNKTVGEEALKNISVNSFEDLLLLASKCCGYNGENKKEAIEFIKNNVVKYSSRLAGKFKDSNEYSVDFAKQTGLFGLAFSLLSQYTEQSFGFSEEGNLEIKACEKESIIGKDRYEKTYIGVVNWINNVLDSVDVESLQNTNDKTNMLASSLIKLVSNKKVKKVIMILKDKNKKELLTKALLGDFINPNNPERIDLKKEIGNAAKIQTLTLILNECIVRAFYAIRRFVFEIQEKDIDSLDGLKNINWKRILPYNNRTVTRMITVSTSIFVTVTTAKAAIVSSKASGTWGQLALFVLNINYPGSFQLVAAIKADRKYLVDDAKFLIHEIKQHYKLVEPKRLVNLDKMLLNEEQLRILYSMKYDEIKYDISKTNKEPQINYKQKWLEYWKNKVLTVINKDESYFIAREDLLKYIEQEKNKNTNHLWLDLMLMESLFFTPYYPIDDFKVNKKITQSSFYEKDILCEQLNLVSFDKLEQIKNWYTKNMDNLNKKNRNRFTAAIITLAIATGGVPFIFVPPELVMLGLGVYEASLVLESSLVGGNLYSFLGAGVSSFNANGIILNETAKLLTLCNLLEKNNDLDLILNIKQALEAKQVEAKVAIDKIVANKNKDNASILANYRKSLSYIETGISILNSNEYLKIESH